MNRLLIKYCTALILISLLFPLKVLGFDSESITLKQSINQFFKETHGYFDVNGYYDLRRFNVFTNNTLIDFPKGFQYFSFTNIFGPLNSASDFKLNKYYTEQNFRWKLPNKIPFSLGVQWVSGSNFGDVLRTGPMIRFQDVSFLKELFKKLNLVYQVTFFPLQYDRSSGYDALIEHFYRTQLFPKLLGDRVYVSGFADMNLLYGSDNKKAHVPWVTETQLGIRMIDQIYLVAEYRYNDFFSKGKKNGLGIGVEYLFKF